MEFRGFTNLEQLPAGADQLFALAQAQQVFFSRPWLKLLCDEATAQGEDLLLAAVIEAENLLALLPLVAVKPGSFKSLGHTYSSLYTLLLAEHDQPAVLDCLVSGLLALPMLQLTLEPIAQDDQAITMLQQLLESRHVQCHRGFRFDNWYEPIGGRAFRDYLAARPGPLRNTIKRKQRKLQREHDYALQLYRGRQITAAMGDFHAVYLASWKGRENYRPFIDDLVTALSGSDQLWLGVLSIDSQPAAAQLWFVSKSRASIFKLAYDEAWAAYSPGSLLTAYLVEQVIGQTGVTEIDFLYGNDAYKQDWMTQRRQRQSLFCRKNPQSNTAWSRLLRRLQRDR